MSISYIVCAAGHGTRTREITSQVPKPFLKLNGKTLLERSVESLPMQSEDQLIVILLREHESWLSDYGPEGADYIFLDEVTAGQAETAYKAYDQLRHRKAAIFNSDTFFSQKGLYELMKNDNIDGLIPCSRQSGHEWSFCRVVPESGSYRAVEVAEKKRISDFCSVGFYYFRDIQDFFIPLAKKINQQLGQSGTEKVGELYVAPFYQSLILEGKKIFAPLVDDFKPMGSVEQIEKYWGVSLDQMRQQQR